VFCAFGFQVSTALVVSVSVLASAILLGGKARPLILAYVKEFAGTVAMIFTSLTPGPFLGYLGVRHISLL
jgi:hypothetical protein